MVCLLRRLNNIEYINGLMENPNATFVVFVARRTYKTLI